MKARINGTDHEFSQGTRFFEVVNRIRESEKDEPMIRTIREKTGKDYIVFTLNGRIVRPEEFETLEIREGDDIRWVHPYVGG